MSSYDEDSATIVDVMAERRLRPSRVNQKFRYQSEYIADNFNRGTQQEHFENSPNAP